jgi:autophagy-related protein 13
MKCGAFVDTSRIKQYTEEDHKLPETPPFNWLLRKTRDESAESKIEEEKLSSSQNDENSSPNNINNNNNNMNNLNSRIAEAAKLSQSPKDNSGTSPSSLKSQSRWSVRENNKDDKFLKELQFPFANQSPIGDLAKFYRECFNAPPLESFTTLESDPTFEDVEADTIDDLTKQLEQFETSLSEYDGLITSLCESENQNS